MEEWDLGKRKLIKGYTVPTGPASSYRMDDAALVINRSALMRWNRHDQLTDAYAGDFNFVLHHP